MTYCNEKALELGNLHGCNRKMKEVILELFYKFGWQITRAQEIEMISVPQGSILGPFIFTICFMERAVTIAYADGLAIMAEADDENEQEYRVSQSL